MIRSSFERTSAAFSIAAACSREILEMSAAFVSVRAPDELQRGELVAFVSSSPAMEFEAQSDAEFIVGSAVPA